jgi:hypothetical protein
LSNKDIDEMNWGEPTENWDEEHILTNLKATKEAQWHWGNE